MYKILRDLLRFDGRFRAAFILLIIMLVLMAMSWASPYDMGKTFQVGMDLAPSLKHPFGTNTRGQDVFWWMTFAVRNSLYLGIVTAIVSRIIAIIVGLTAGYRGGFLDRFLMSINDSFVVIPILPILILVSFLLRDKMNISILAVFLGIFGWPWDARLIRAQVLSLKERAFTKTAIYSGTKSFRITVTEHLPFVLPVVFATTINNMIWSIGMEVTLGVLGLSSITTPTLGSTIYWANNHQALIAGVWWWLAAPILISIMLFLGLYMLISSINEYIDPRTRLRRMGA
jgi:peptide/nickel transport system permease protein